VDADDRPEIYLLCAHLMGDLQAAALNHNLGPQGTVLHVACQRGSLFAAQLFLWVCSLVDKCAYFGSPSLNRFAID
jgi:hypothetical protein